MRSLLYTWNQTPSPCMSLSLSMNELVLPDEDSVVASLAKVIMFLVALVCLSVCLFCLFVDNITPKIMNGLG